MDVLANGAGGVAEARTSLSSYPDASPLYGLIIYRRKRVVIKYIPDGTSRLLQARTAVHFQGVIEEFAPHDALLEITASEGLSDTALAASFPLHAGSATTKNLDEIAEDGEEAPATDSDRQRTASPAPSKLSRKAALERVAAIKRAAAIAQRPVASIAEELAEPSVAPVSDDLAPRPSVDSQSISADMSADMPAITPATTRQSDNFEKTNGEVDAAVTTKAVEGKDAEAPFVISSSRDNHLSGSPLLQQKYTVNNDGLGLGLNHELPRTSTDTTLTNATSLNDYGMYDFKPKIKLAPRQVQIRETKRASQVPASIRRSTAMTPAFNESPTTQEFVKPVEGVQQEEVNAVIHPKPADSPMMVHSSFSSINIPSSLDKAETQLPPRPGSSASVRSARTGPYKTPMTPERQRLMKAMEVRKRQQRKSQQVAILQSQTPAAEPIQDTTPVIPEIDETAANSAPPEPVVEQADAADVLPVPSHDLKGSDSGVGMSAETKPADESAVTLPRSDSHSEASSKDIAASIDNVSEEDDTPTPTDVRSQPLVAEPAHDASMQRVDTVAVPGDGVDIDDYPSPVEAPATTESALPSSPVTAAVAILPPTPEDDDSLVIVSRPVTPTPQEPNAAPALQQTPNANVPYDHKVLTSTYVSPTESSISTESDKIGHRTFFRESGSTLNLPPSRDGFYLDTSSEASEPGRTWLSDNSPPHTRSSSLESPNVPEDPQKRKRHGLVVPQMAPAVVGTPSSFNRTPQTGSTNDEDFEYFANATVHEATPVAVMRSPTLPSKPSLVQLRSSPPSQPTWFNSAESTSPKQLVSPVTSNFASPERLASPQIRSSTPPRAKSSHSTSSSISPDDLVAQSRKSQIGSGISERIARLAQSRSRELSPLASPASMSQLSTHSGRRPAHVAFESRSQTQPGRLTPQPFAGGNVQNRYNPPGMKQNGDGAKRQSNAYYTVHKDPETRRESVSVTARIVRPNQQAELQLPTVLQPPELSVEPPPEGRRTREPSTASTAKREPSIGSTLSRKSLESSKLKRFSFSRKSHDTRPDSSGSGLTTLRPPSPITEPVPPLPSSPTKSNRTSRFLKRMSGLSAVSRKRPTKPSPSLTASTLPEDHGMDSPMLPPAMEPSLSETMLDGSTHPFPVRIGDVNVQFPHTGLWKRRYVEIDIAGRLVFSMNNQSSIPSRHFRGPVSLYSSNAAAVASAKLGVRIFDLRSVMGLYAPRPDDMELANSVVLRLAGDEGALTIACEDARGQGALLMCKYFFPSSLSLS